MFRYYFLFLMTICHLTLSGDSAISSLELPNRSALTYKSPTVRFQSYYGYEYILEALKSHGLSLAHRNFFEHIPPHEELGFFGYHSSTQGFRIYQDIIRLVLEEICDIQIKKDFHFLRIPGKPIFNRQNKWEFLKDYPKVFDGKPELQEQLLSMNFSLYGNFNWFGSCTIYWFTVNSSAMTVGYQNQLFYLFNLLGISTDELPHLFSIGSPLMSADNAVLFQFFDFSHHNPFENHYSFVDEMCYESFSLGVPIPTNSLFSENYLGNHTTPFPMQLRLVINNYLTLNPYSALHIKRYDRNDPLIIKQYEKDLRQAIKNLPFDKNKADEYRKQLLIMWGQSNEN